MPDPYRTAWVIFERNVTEIQVRPISHDLFYVHPSFGGYAYFNADEIFDTRTEAVTVLVDQLTLEIERLQNKARELVASIAE